MHAVMKGGNDVGQRITIVFMRSRDVSEIGVRRRRASPAPRSMHTAFSSCLSDIKTSSGRSIHISDSSRLAS